MNSLFSFSFLLPYQYSFIESTHRIKRYDYWKGGGLRKIRLTSVLYQNVDYWFVLFCLVLFCFALPCFAFIFHFFSGYRRRKTNKINHWTLWFSYACLLVFCVKTRSLNSCQVSTAMVNLGVYLILSQIHCAHDSNLP